MDPVRAPGVALAVALWLIAAVRPAGASIATRLPEAAGRAMRRAGAMIQAGDRPGGIAVLDSLERAAATSGDTTLGLAAAISRGGHLAWAGDLRAAEAVLETAVPLAEAHGDSALFVTGSMWWADALTPSGRHDEARRVAQRALPVAEEIGDGEREGFLRKNLAYIDLMDSRFDQALHGYQAAHRLLRKAGNSFGEVDALTGMARAYDHLGRIDDGARCFREVARLSHERGLSGSEADAWNNLAVQEFNRGDPQAALDAFRSSFRIQQALGDQSKAITVAVNVSACLALLGRHREAEAGLDSLARICSAAGRYGLESQVLDVLGSLHLDQGERTAALRVFQRMIDLGANQPVWYLARGHARRARTLADIDSLDAALGILSGPLRELRPLLRGDRALDIDVDLAQVLLRAGQNEEAIRVALSAGRNAAVLERGLDHAVLLAIAGRAELRLGRPTEALRHLRIAADQWEKARARPSDPQWRERTAHGQQISAALIETLLAQPGAEEGRNRSAFDAAQPFKGRSLMERLLGERRAEGRGPLIGLDRLQRDVLRPGELFLDCYVGDEQSYLFAVTRGRCSVLVLPGAPDLRDRIRLFRDLVALPADGSASGASARTEATTAAQIEAAGAVQTEAAAALGRTLLGPVGQMIRDAHTVIYSPDGPLQALPFEVLRVSFHDSEPPAPLGTERSLSRVASATMLGLARGASDPDGAGREDGAVIISGGFDARGQRLAGADAEARSLSRRYAGFQKNTPLADTTIAGIEGWLARPIVHFAAHTVFDDQCPWRSGLLLPAQPESTRTFVLRAETIATLSLQSRLVVLSGCESAGGLVLPGEGVLGISSAFLAAGVPSLVATVWPVEDVAAKDVALQLYRHLASGHPVGEALRLARREMASSSTHSSAQTWAAYVCLGDPDVRVRVAPRSVAPHLILAGAVLVILCVAAAIRLKDRLGSSSV